ncbi:MAG: ABC transporter ATP-binding protein [Chloroflexota bacterium]
MHIHIEHLRKRFGSVVALRDVSLDIGDGMYGLLGPNGAGKTTLMRVMTTLLQPSGGRVVIDGHDVTSEPQAVRRLLGYLPQEFGFHRQLTAGEALEYVAALKGIPVARRRAAVSDVLEQVNLADVRRRRVGGLSGGMRQRLGIAQALLGDPRLVIVDEPTAGLDPEERIRFRNLLARLSENRTVVLSTHVVADVEASCAALAVLRRGELAFAGTADQLIARAAGQTWDLACSVNQWERLSSSLRVVRSRPVGSQVFLRVLSARRPTPDAEPAEPSLEDGYLAVVGSGGAANG